MTKPQSLPGGGVSSGATGPMQGSGGCLIVGESSLLDGAPAAANGAIEATKQFDTCVGQGRADADCAHPANACPSTPVAQGPRYNCLTPDQVEMCQDEENSYQDCVASAEQLSGNFAKCADIHWTCSQGRPPCGA